MDRDKQGKTRIVFRKPEANTRPIIDVAEVVLHAGVVQCLDDMMRTSCVQGYAVMTTPTGPGGNSAVFVRVGRRIRKKQIERRANECGITNRLS